MAKVKAVEGFYDIAGKCLRAAGEEWECADDRASQLCAYGLTVLSEVEEEPKPKPKRSRKKAE